MASVFERIPLVGSLVNRDGTSSNDQEFVNCYPQVMDNPVTGKKTVYLLKRPGYAKGGALTGVASAGASGAIIAWTGSALSTPPVVAAFLNTGGTTMSVWDLVTDAKKGGDITAVSTCTALTETSISGTANLVGNFFDSSSGTLEQWFYPEGGTWTQVTDSDFPSGITGVPVHMDGYVFNITRDGKIYNSDLNSISAYTAGSFISASQYPDKGVTLARLGPHIIAFGEKSIERFYNAGNAVGSPLARVQDGGIPMGAARITENGTQQPPTILQSVLQAHSTIYWIGTNNDCAATGVYRFSGGSPQKISNPAIDMLLQRIAITGFVGTLLLHGMRMVVMRGTGGTYCFSVDNGIWWKLTLQAGEIGACIAANPLLNPPSAINYFIGTNNARANTMNGSVNQDDGSNFTATVQTQNLDHGTTKRKAFRSLRLVGDDPAATSNVGVAWSDDDYASFTTARNIDLNTYPSPALRNLGNSRRRAWKLTNTANTKLRLEALELEYEVTPWS